jgi:ABC-2 type transport system permease protein
MAADGLSLLDFAALEHNLRWRRHSSARGLLDRRADRIFQSWRAVSVSAPALGPAPAFTLAQYVICFRGIVWREGLRFLHQRERFISALVRPLVWLFIFAAGFRQVLGVSIIPPYETYVLYEVYITPGLLAMIQLFNGMQSSLSMVYDREMGSMRTLLISPFPRWFLLGSKLVAGALVSILQVYAFLAIAWFWEIEPPHIGYLTVLPALILSGLMFGSLGMLLSSLIRQLENFAGVMNFVIFPMFFASSALYPLWRIKESSVFLYQVCEANPFTHAVELIRFALYGRIEWLSLGVVAGCTAVFMIGAIMAYDPSRGLAALRRGGA